MWEGGRGEGLIVSLDQNQRADIQYLEHPYSRKYNMSMYSKCRLSQGVSSKKMCNFVQLLYERRLFTALTTYLYLVHELHPQVPQFVVYDSA